MWVEDSLEILGLDKEMIEEHSKGKLTKDVDKILAGFFRKREKISEDLSDWISSNFETMEDGAIFWSVICEHMQNFLMPDMEYFYDIIVNMDKDMDEKFEHWIIVAGEFENFQMASMSTYYKSRVKEYSREQT